MAPEVITGNYSFPCDIWSCGVLLYLLYTGDILFPGKHDKDMIDLFEKDYLEILDEKLIGCSDELKDLLIKMLTKNPVKRIKTNTALQHPWFCRFANGDESPTKKRKVQILENFDKFQVNFKATSIGFITIKNF
jgi:calcium-dependent protein kinase